MDIEPIEPKKSWLSRHMVLGYAFLFLVFAGIVGGIYWYQYGGINNPQSVPQQALEQKDETEGWKKYRNEQYGFEFSYPQDRFLVNPSDGVDYENTVIVDKTKAGQPGVLIITAMKKSINNDTACEKEVGEVSVGGMAIKKCRASEPDDRWTASLSSSLADFRLDCWVPAQNDEICEQILSTFKFTDTTSADTSTWKTYTNTQYGFEFQYPSDWNIKNSIEDYPGFKLLVKVINPEHPGKEDTDIPIEQLLVYISNTCQDHDWEIGFANLEYKQACIKNGNSYFQIDLMPIEPDSKGTMEQILSTFKFTND